MQLLYDRIVCRRVARPVSWLMPALHPTFHSIDPATRSGAIDSYPSARGTGHRDRDRHRLTRMEWQCTTEIHRPRTHFAIQHARLYAIITKTLGGFATSLSWFITDHHPLGAGFFSLFTIR